MECLPDSQRALHAHPTQEQVYVIVRGHGQMLVGDAQREVEPGTLIYVPPATPHAIRNIGIELLVYVSATAPPFRAAVSGQTCEIPGAPG